MGKSPRLFSKWRHLALVLDKGMSSGKVGCLYFIGPSKIVRQSEAVFSSNVSISFKQNFSPANLFNVTMLRAFFLFDTLSPCNSRPQVNDTVCLLNFKLCLKFTNNETVYFLLGASCLGHVPVLSTFFPRLRTFPTLQIPTPPFRIAL